MTDITTEARLLPCPFCGANPRMMETQGGFGWRVKCTSCLAQSGGTFMQAETAEKWNTRPSPTEDARGEIPLDHPLAKALQPSPETMKRIEQQKHDQAAAYQAVRNMPIGSDTRPSPSPERVEELAKAFCREACAECGDPPCYEIDPEWMAHSDPNVNCNCVALAKVALATLQTSREEGVK